MSSIEKHNVQVEGSGTKTLVLAHGFGCDQNAWNHLKSFLEQQYKLVSFDYIGAGGSDRSAFDPEKYSTLQGYATDLIGVCDALQLQHVVFVGHSVSCMIGLLASIRRPELFSHLVLIGPSPRYINEPGYAGGFDKETIETLMQLMEKDYMSWANQLAPAIMDVRNGEQLGKELTDSFCRVDPAIAKHFARTTFFGDNRKDIALCSVPSLIINCKEDIISPVEVVEYVHGKLPANTIAIIESTGHCPHMSAPKETSERIIQYLEQNA